MLDIRTQCSRKIRLGKIQPDDNVWSQDLNESVVKSIVGRLKSSKGLFQGYSVGQRKYRNKNMFR